MSLVVKPTMTANPPTIPRAGGATTLTFEAQASDANSQLRARFDPAPGSTYRITGSNSLGPKPVPLTFKDFSLSLDLEPLPGVTPGSFVTIVAQVQEIDANGKEVGAPRRPQGNVNIKPGMGTNLAVAAAAVAGAVAGAAAGAATAAVLSGGGAAPQGQEQEEGTPPEAED